MSNRIPLSTADDEILVFAEEEAVTAPTLAPWRVLAVDDDPDFQAAVAFSLKDALLLDRPLELVHASSMAQAVRVLAKGPEFAAVLVDVVMETDDAGLRLVKAIREMLGHFDTRIILLTGQPGFAPMDSVFDRYDLSDYCLKSDIHRRGIKNILTGALRGYRDISAVSFARRSLNLILQTSNRLVGKRRQDEIANIVLSEISHMLHLPPDGVVCVKAKSERHAGTDNIVVIGATGALADLAGKAVNMLPDREITDALAAALHSQRDVATNHGRAVIFPPHLSFEHYAAYIATDRPLEKTEYELLKVFTDTAARGFGTANLLNDLERQAFVDPLLKIANRNAMVRHIQEVLDYPESTPQNLVKIDIDNFNGINAAFGYEHASQLLIAICAAIQRVFPPPHFLARVAPDRFYIIGPADQVNLEAAQAIFEHPILVEGNEYAVTACYARIPLTGSGKTPEEVLRATNAAMRAAKARGPGSRQDFNPAFEDAARQRFAVSSALAQAVPKGELQTMIQPQVRLADGRVIGGELLLRWFQANGTALPGVFIPIAEQSSLIHKIGQIVIQQAMQALIRLEQAGRGDLVLGINVSPREFENDNYVAELLHCCERHAVSPSRIELEVLESTVMGNFDRVSQQLAQFRAAGGAVSIDDFGTGMSSLAYLMDLPHDRIKIDRSFVRQIEHNMTAQRLTRMVIDLGRSLDKSVIAEGVEATPQAEWLRNEGCHQAQGWLYAAAMSLDDFIRFGR